MSFLGDLGLKFDFGFLVFLGGTCFFSIFVL